MAALGLLGIGFGTNGTASGCNVDFTAGGRGGGYIGSGGSIGISGTTVSIEPKPLCDT